jgi:hypothetical protein
MYIYKYVQSHIIIIIIIIITIHDMFRSQSKYT